MTVFFSCHTKLLLLRARVPSIVTEVHVFKAERPNRGHLHEIPPGLRLRICLRVYTGGSFISFGVRH